MRSLCLGLTLAVVGCTTSFETSRLRVRDGGAADVTTDVAADLGAPDAPMSDAPAADVPAADVVADARDGGAADGPACGEQGQPCCAAAASACAPGTVCNEGTCASCPSNTVACASSCVDLRTSLSHCGSCGAACAQGQSCVGGTCTLVCPMSLNLCGDRCVDLAHNAAHCGRCGAACAAGEVCEGASCIVSCSPGQTVCAGGCVDTQSDSGHCGGCGRACSLPHAVSRCAAGACSVAACDAGFGDCDMNPANGCETSLSSLTSCGRCGERCEVAAGTPSCAGGRCAVSACDAGFGDCDMNPANGCETDLRRDTRNCGGCGRVCSSASGAATCNDGVCGTSTAMCPPNLAECVGPDTTDCETDLRSPDDCGRCGNVCALPNANNACASGSCAVGSCQSGYGNCDSIAANGCEVDLNNSTAHCGVCGRACSLPHAVPVCARGVCAIGSCEQGFANCDGNASNGCEVDLRASVSNCGVCGARCPTANSTAACVDGRCAVGACSPGFADCDGNVNNGCEARTSSDVANCGTCQNACVLPNATPECSNGACRVQRCADGFADCDGNASNGCEVDLRTSAQHCGGCNERCVAANGTGGCEARRCTVAACNGGFADCDRDVGNGCETSLNNSSANCGSCGRACADGTVCTAGQCTSNCSAGTVLCGGVCVDTSSSTAHCGGCAVACPARPNAVATCASGSCGLACNAGFGDCDGDPTNGCETRLNSLTHCGRCGLACANAPNARGYCSGGACQLSCEGSFRDCDGDPSNGCEVNVANDPGNCGVCLNRCPRQPNSLPVCRQGACTIECNYGWGDCLTTAGCETNLLGNSYRCGSCVGVCLAGRCRGGVCTLCTGTETTSCPSSVLSDQDLCGVNLFTDARHCGACGQACPSVGTRLNHANYLGTCLGGACQLTCEGTWRDCDGNWQNGCEVNVACDRDHCGGCRNGGGVVCGSASVCCDRVCQPASTATCNRSAPGCR